MNRDSVSQVTRSGLSVKDSGDPLRGFRGKFGLPDGLVYLDGNSLGALPHTARAVAERVLAQEWGRDLIQSWNTAGWFELPARLGDKIGKLVGAGQGTVVCTDTTSANLFKVLAVALRLRPKRRVIVSERANFPTDLYIAQGLARFLSAGHELRLVDEQSAIAEALRDDTAVLMLTHVNYRTGELHDMAGLTRLAHARGALVVWDLAHSVGAVPVDLTGDDVDFAVGCTYKYLNGGPGAPAFLYAASALQNACEQPLSGWWGHAAPFEFSSDYRPSQGIGRFLCGTQPVLSMAISEAGIDLVIEAGIDRLRAKSIALTEAFIAAVEQECAGQGLTLVSPREARRRGSQVSFHHEHAYPIMQALIARRVIGDYREPGILRFGFTPLYTRYTDVWDAMTALRDLLETRGWDRPEYHQRNAVT
jgi:kynureninase